MCPKSCGLPLPWRPLRKLIGWQLAALQPLPQLSTRCAGHAALHVADSTAAAIQRRLEATVWTLCGVLSCTMEDVSLVDFVTQGERTAVFDGKVK